MELSNWIEKEELSRSEAAKKLDLSESQLSRLITGTRKPTAMQAHRITVATDGAVTLVDFFGDAA